MDSIFSRHTNVALSFSGGKDSTALLHMYRHWWDKLTVYWLNTGDAFPETVELMAHVRSLVPNFKEVQGRQPQIIAQDGWPSDVVPQAYTTLGNTVHGPTEFKVQTRLDCCYRSMMLPMYQAMLADGVTCILRGKRHDEKDKTGLVSGYVSPEGVETVFPLYDWTSADVHRYLEQENVPLPKFYEHGNSSIDCMNCTAWWGEGHAKYLLAEHPLVFQEYKRRVVLIKRAVADQLSECEV